MMGMQMVRAMLLASVVVLSTSCASIPVSTMMRMSSFDEARLASLDPAAIRVRVATPEGIAVDTDAIELGAVLGIDGKQTQEDFGLTELVRASGSRSIGFFSGDVPVVEHEFALTAESVQRFASLQREILSAPAGSFEFKVNAPLSEMPPGTKSIRFWIDLKLESDSPYMVLFDGAEVPMRYTD